MPTLASGSLPCSRCHDLPSGSLPCPGCSVLSCNLHICPALDVFLSCHCICCPGLNILFCPLLRYPVLPSVCSPCSVLPCPRVSCSVMLLDCLPFLGALSYTALPPGFLSCPTIRVLVVPSVSRPPSLSGSYPCPPLPCPAFGVLSYLAFVFLTLPSVSCPAFEVFSLPSGVLFFLQGRGPCPARGDFALLCLRDS